MPLPVGLESIAGAEQLCEWFGYWPDFHDAEVLKFHLQAGKPSSVTVHTWEMTSKVNTQGHYELTKHAVVEFVLEGIINANLVDLWDHSILLDLGVEKTEAGFRLSFCAAYGLSGAIEVQGLSLRITPGNPSLAA
jgi:hypothetical protein